MNMLGLLSKAAQGHGSEFRSAVTKLELNKLVGDLARPREVPAPQGIHGGLLLGHHLLVGFVGCLR
jgi:hypothetical protein